MSWKPKYLVQTWEFKSLRYEVVKDLDTGKIVRRVGNPDVANLVTMVSSLAQAYHKLLRQYVNMYRRAYKLYR